MSVPRKLRVYAMVIVRNPRSTQDGQVLTNLRQVDDKGTNMHMGWQGLPLCVRWHSWGLVPNPFPNLGNLRDGVLARVLDRLGV